MELWKGLRPYMDFTLSIHYPHVYIYIIIYIYIHRLFDCFLSRKINNTTNFT